MAITTHFGLIAQSKQNPSALTRFKKIEWILGQWERMNVKDGQTAFETWTKTSSSLLEGIGVSMVGSDTTFVERLKIEIKEDDIYYIADVKENATPTYFKITSLTKNGFVSKNPSHDFPKLIQYDLKENTMTVVISDGKQKRMGFIFQKD